jgi:hypothetical protein
MKAIARSLVVILVALIAVPALVVSVTITTAVQLLAATVLVLGGTGHSLAPGDDPTYVIPYLGNAENNYVDPASGGGSYTVYAVTYPAQFFPVSGTTTFDDSVTAGVGNLGQCLSTHGDTCGTSTAFGTQGDPTPSPADEPPYIVFGYSQSAVVASLVKGDLISAADPTLDRSELVLVSNPMRENGGILGRGFEGLTIPIIGITFYGGTPNSCDTDPCSVDDDFVLPTTDVAQQYDILGGDAPARLDPLAFANSLAAYALLHGNMPNRSIEPGPGGVPADHGVVYQDTYGDTTYYLVTAPRLPLLLIAEQAGVPGAALALPDALLRVWIEDKYRRDLSPGENVDFQLSPIGNPVNLVGNMLGAIPVGIDDTVAQASGDPNNRPLGTANVYRPFGVGGPVYNPTTGLPAQDNVGITNPGGAGKYPEEQGPIQALGTPQTGDTNKLAIDADELGNDVTPEGNETPDAIRPDPFAKLRESFKADPSRPLAGLRPSGDGPLKRIVNALTGQKPKTESAEPEAKEESPAA